MVKNKDYMNKEFADELYHLHCNNIAKITNSDNEDTSEQKGQNKEGG